MFLMMPHGPTESKEVVHGYFSQYAEAPTRATIAIRQEWGQLPEDMSLYPVRLAVENCSLIGETGWARMADQPWERAIVFDCSGHDSTSRWMIENNIIAEVDWDTVQRWGIEGQGGIEGSVFLTSLEIH